MRTSHPRSVPPTIWAWVLATLAGILVAAAWSWNQDYPGAKESRHILNCFRPERLFNNNANTLVVMGTSAVRHAFPFDSDLEELARKQDMQIHFVRFSLNAGTPREFSVLADRILEARPRWVFIQVEPFVLHLRSSHWYRRALEKARHDLHHLLKELLMTVLNTLNKNYPCRGFQQDDTGLNLQEVADMNKIRNALHDDYQLLSPRFPARFEDFLERAGNLGIEVILLEINRSQAGNEAFGKEFRSALNELLKNVASYYQLPLWQFSAELPLEYYADRAHLNQQGRQKFTGWFLSHLKEIYP